MEMFPLTRLPGMTSVVFAADVLSAGDLTANGSLLIVDFKQRKRYRIRQ
jgi:hypothetical protein